MVKQRRGTHRIDVESDVEKWINPTKLCPRTTVTLKPGRAFTPSRYKAQAVHTRSFTKAKLARAAVLAAKPCTCDRCAMRGKVKK